MLTYAADGGRARLFFFPTRSACKRRIPRSSRGLPAFKKEPTKHPLMPGQRRRSSSTRGPNTRAICRPVRRRVPEKKNRQPQARPLPLHSSKPAWQSVILARGFFQPNPKNFNLKPLLFFFLFLPFIFFSALRGLLHKSRRGSKPTPNTDIRRAVTDAI